jgi:hypothetical protein
MFVPVIFNAMDWIVERGCGEYIAQRRGRTIYRQTVFFCTSTVAAGVCREIIFKRPASAGHGAARPGSRRSQHLPGADDGVQVS